MAANPSTDNQTKMIAQGFRIIFLQNALLLSILTRQTANTTATTTLMVSLMEQFRLLIVDYWTGGGTAPGAVGAAPFDAGTQGAQQTGVTEANAEVAYDKDIADRIISWFMEQGDAIDEDEAAEVYEGGVL